MAVRPRRNEGPGKDYLLRPTGDSAVEERQQHCADSLEVGRIAFQDGRGLGVMPR